jgi:hypothetical protein
MKNIEVIIGEYFTDHNMSNRTDLSPLNPWTVALGLDQHCSNNPVSPNAKAIVFDLDETIGQFSNLQQLNNAFEVILRRSLKQEEFNELIDLYPEFLRPGILTILEFLAHKKKANAFQKMYLYTNNQCGREWVHKIINYMETKIQSQLFDDIICAFKIKNKVVEIKRSTHNKTHAELIKCTIMKEANTEICFIDNTYFEKMCGDKVYYILPRSYYHSLLKQEIIDRLLNHIPVSVAPFNRDILHDTLYNYCKENPNKNRDIKIDAEVTKKIMFHIREYLYFAKNCNKILKIPRNVKSARKPMTRCRKNKTVKKM